MESRPQDPLRKVEGGGSPGAGADQKGQELPAREGRGSVAREPLPWTLFRRQVLEPPSKTSMLGRPSPPFKRRPPVRR